MNSKRGFTLIELLVVIAVIGMLASIVLVALGPTRGKSRDARRQADITQIRTALELYYDDNSQYPSSGGAAASPNSSWNNSGSSASWNLLKTALASYIDLPEDPTNDSSGWADTGKYNYVYYSQDSGPGACPQQWYTIVYKLENTTVGSSIVKACSGWQSNYSGEGVVNVGMCQGCN